MEKDNLTAVLYGIEDIRLEQRPIPEIDDNEVLLEMDCVGICGSDVHYLVHGRIGDFVVEQPMVIGHEASGVVTRIGKDVTHLQIGDRVAIEPGYGCRVCDYCKSGRYNLCEKMIFCATPPINGNLTKFYKHPADFCFKLPPNVTMEEAALLEPLSVGVHACRRAGVGLGSQVLVIGAGPIGLVSMLAAKAMGAGKILITDMLESRLEVAKSLGATFTMVITKDMTEDQLIRQVHATMGSPPDRAIDCFGGQSSARLAILATRSGGNVAIVGMAQAEANLPMTNAVVREINVHGVFRYCNDYPAALAMVASGAVDVKKLVTHHYDITETEKAFETARYGHGGAIKVMIHCQPRDKNNTKPFDS